MHLTEMDRLASTGKSRWHGASVPAKLLFSLFCIATALASRSPAKTAALLCLLLFITTVAGLKPAHSLALLGLPVMLAAFFSLAASAESVSFRLLIVLRSACSASAMLLLLSTTTVFDLCSLVSRLSPVCGDAILLTYRSLFILSDRFSAAVLAIRVRGGTQAGLLHTITQAGNCIGATLIAAIESAERLQRTLLLRGYEPAPRCDLPRFRSSDLLPASLALVISLGGMLL